MAACWRRVGGVLAARWYAVKTAETRHHHKNQMGGTLESKYAERVAEFQARKNSIASRMERASEEEKSALRRELCAVEDDETRYMLDSLPFIKEYADDAKPVAVTAKPPPAAGHLSKLVAVTHTSNRNNVLQRYLMRVENQVDMATVAAVTADDNAGVSTQSNEYVCPTCDMGMEFHARESLLVCVACGMCKTFSEMSANNLTYEQEVHQDVVTYYSYKRLNHFCEWLNSLQAKVGARWGLCGFRGVVDFPFSQCPFLFSD